MPSLSFDQYGKTDVRLTQVLRSGGRHQLTELSVRILFRGDFARSYTEADNSIVLPTDTMKNTVYAVARQHPIQSIEAFAQDLAGHFLSRVERLTEVEVAIAQTPWARIADHDSAFALAGKDRRVTRISASRDKVKIVSGMHDLEILKTAHSGFSGFQRDYLTTLQETEDRLLGTVMDANWTYRRNSDVDFNAEYSRLRSLLLETFANHISKSVQHTLYDMATAALSGSEALAEIHLVMPNKHRILADLGKFGLDNPNQIFIPVDEPSGYIEARVRA